MSCAPLASTGVPALALIALGAVLLVAGAVLVLLTRGRHAGGATAIVLLLLIGGGLATGITGSSVARAATPACATSPNPSPSAGAGDITTAEDSLTIIQTSTMTGLAPGIAPAAITGTVTNRATTSTFVTAITVSVAAVTEALGATAGTCDASDYILFDPAMPVGRTLAPGESLDFGGARIGFSDKPLNQDACQNAAISLRYVSS